MITLLISKEFFANGSLLFEGGNKYANENNWAVMPTMAPA